MARRNSYKTTGDDDPNRFNPYSRRIPSNDQASPDEEQAPRLPVSTLEEPLAVGDVRRRLSQDAYHQDAVLESIRPVPQSDLEITPVGADSSIIRAISALSDAALTRQSTILKDADDKLRRACKEEYQGQPSSSESAERELQTISRMTTIDEVDLDVVVDQRHTKPSRATIPVGAQLKVVLFPQWVSVNWLLLNIPAGFALYYTQSSPIPTFITNLLVVIPCSAIIMFAADELVLRVGDNFGTFAAVTFR